MKKIVFIALTLLVLSSCAGGSGPEPVAKNFLNKLGALDFKGAAKYATDEGAAALNMMQSFMAMAPQEELNAMKGKPTIISTTVNGDKAVVIYTMSGDTDEQALDMVKVNGKWKVNFQKEM